MTTIHGCNHCGATWTAPVTSCPKGPHDPNERNPRVQRIIDDPEAYFAEARAYWTEALRRDEALIRRAKFTHLWTHRHFWRQGYNARGRSMCTRCLRDRMRTTQTPQPAPHGD